MSWVGILHEKNDETAKVNGRLKNCGVISDGLS
jgi:hypothetical protein